MSPSAFVTHDRVALFLNNDALGHKIHQKAVALRQLPLHTLGGPYNQIDGKLSLKRQGNSNRLINFIACWHHHKQVEIAVRVGQREMGYPTSKLAAGEPEVPAPSFHQCSAEWRVHSSAQ